MSLRSKDELLRALERRYASVWADELCGMGEHAWPCAVRVGKPSRRELEHGFAGLMEQADALRVWAKAHGLACMDEPRLVGRVSYAFLSHVAADDLDVLAQATGNERHLQMCRARREVVSQTFPELDAAQVRQVLVLANRYAMDDVDFELACRAARWFATHDALGLTPREVPLEGFHAKWLDGGGHRQLVCLLAGLDGLVLKKRPRLVRFRYLDPEYLVTGARVHDAWLEGDACELPYEPAVVVICENRDSALWFPPVARGIAVMGDGMAGVSTLAGSPIFSPGAAAFYWGDMDVHGLEILATYRERGLAVRSVCMDVATYDAYERYGTFVDRYGRRLPAIPDARALPGLTEAENELYLRLCDPDFAGPRRIEQERIPLSVARDAIIEQKGGPPFCSIHDRPMLPSQPQRGSSMRP